MRPPFFFTLFLKDNNKMRDNAIIKSNEYGLKSILYSCQDQYILFKKQDNKIYN